MKQIVLRALAGLGFGFGFALLQFVVLGVVETSFSNHTVQPMRAVNSTFQIVNAPAEWLSHVWSDSLRLPPRGEVAWLVVPVGAALLQWGFVGFLGGLWWGFKSAPHANGARDPLWLYFLGAAGALMACALLALIVGAVVARLARSDGPVPPLPPIVNMRGETSFDAAADALEVNPNDPEANCRYGVALAKKGWADDAIMHFRVAIELKPDYAEAYYHMGLVLADKGRLTDALDAYRKALEFKPAFVEARQHLDRALESQRAKTPHP